ncbi:MAG: hypothetical protein AAB217_22535 [Chloroflexota bacterium]|jgi:hypothetical protein
MKIHQTTECTCRVTATYHENGPLSVKVFASAPYNDRGATATAELPVSAELQTELGVVMQKILTESAAPLGAKMGAALHTSRDAASRLGEHTE